MLSFNTDVSGLYLIDLSAARTLLLRRIELHSMRTSLSELPSLPSIARVRWTRSGGVEQQRQIFEEEFVERRDLR